MGCQELQDQWRDFAGNRNAAIRPQPGPNTLTGRDAPTNFRANRNGRPYVTVSFCVAAPRNLQNKSREVTFLLRQPPSGPALRHNGLNTLDWRESVSQQEIGEEIPVPTVGETALSLRPVTIKSQKAPLAMFVWA